MNVWKTTSLVLIGYILGNSSHTRIRPRYSPLKDSISCIMTRKLNKIFLGREDPFERPRRISYTIGPSGRYNNYREYFSDSEPEESDGETEEDSDES